MAPDDSALCHSSLKIFFCSTGGVEPRKNVETEEILIFFFLCSCLRMIHRFIRQVNRIASGVFTHFALLPGAERFKAKKKLDYCIDALHADSSPPGIWMVLSEG